MNCLSEFACSVYTDGESPAEEARQIEAHLAVCARCRSLVNTLRAENRMISTVLAETREELQTLPDWQPASPSGLMLRALAALIFAVVGLRAAFLGLGAWGLSQLGLIEPVSAALEWINPSSWTAQVNLFFSSFFYLVNEGASMLFWLLTAVASVLVVLALASAGYLLARRRPARMNSLAMLNVILGALLLLGVTPRASAIEMHRNENTYTLERGKTVNDTLMIGGDTAIIDGDVNGDLIFGGRKLLVRGNVKGDVLAGTQITEIEGTVGGNVVSFSQLFFVTGKVAGNVYGWSQHYEQNANGIVSGNVLSFSGECDISGEVVRDLWALTGKADINGKVGHNVYVRSDNLNVSSRSTIGGDLDAHVRNIAHAIVEKGATISGKQSIQQEVRDDDISRYMRGRFYFWQLIQLLGALLIGALLLVCCPNFYHGAVEAVGFTWSPLLRSLGLGFAILCAVPLASVLACATLIGIPLGVLALMTYICGLYFSKIFLGAMIGQAILQRTPQNRQDALLALFVGLALFFVVVNLPYAIGPVVHFLVFCVGLGAFGYRLAKSLQPAPAPAI